jgi:hypothetical protein
MPFTTIKILKGELSDQQKAKLMKNVKVAMKAVEMRESNWEVTVNLKKESGFAVVRLSHLSQGANHFRGRVQGSLVGQSYSLFRENDYKNVTSTG